MDAPFVDIHSHSKDTTDYIKVVSLLLGSSSEGIAHPISVGIHPWHSEVHNLSSLDAAFAPYLCNLKAIGEIGLDRCTPTPIERQLSIFEAQLDFALCHHLPVIIHCVRAHSDLIAVMNRHKKNTYILHGFYANTTILRALQKHDTYFSMGLKELKRARGRELVKTIPLDRLFLETDESSTPIEEVYAEAAVAAGISPLLLRKQLFTNYTKLFK